MIPSNSYSILCFGGTDEAHAPKSCFGKGQRLRFLVVLDSDEFKQRGCWFIYSKIDAILQNARMFPGKIEVLPTEDLNPAIHICEQNAFIKNRLYVRIPKERVYIPIEEFEEKYVFSQLTELNLLFLHLNAENVKMTTRTDNPLLTTRLFGIHSGIDRYVESMGANQHDEIVEIRYPAPKSYTAIDPCKYFYYEKWKSLVDNRREKLVGYDEYVYVYEKPAFLSDQFIEALKTIGLNVNMNNTTNNFQLDFEIFYYLDEM